MTVSPDGPAVGGHRRRSDRSVVAHRGRTRTASTPTRRRRRPGRRCGRPRPCAAASPRRPPPRPSGSRRCAAAWVPENVASTLSSRSSTSPARSAASVSGVAVTSGLSARSRPARSRRAWAETSRSWSSAGGPDSTRRISTRSSSSPNAATGIHPSSGRSQVVEPLDPGPEVGARDDVGRTGPSSERVRERARRRDLDDLPIDQPPAPAVPGRRRSRSRRSGQLRRLPASQASA